MNKGLDALNEMRKYGAVMIPNCEIIEQELKEYEEMKAIKGTTTFDKAIEDTLINACPNVAKKLKAFEIIIKTLPAFVYAITNSKDYQDYSSHYISPIITQEQYDLLKEVLKDGK